MLLQSWSNETEAEIPPLVATNRCQIPEMLLYWQYEHFYWYYSIFTDKSWNNSQDNVKSTYTTQIGFVHYHMIIHKVNTNKNEKLAIRPINPKIKPPKVIWNVKHFF